MDLRLDFKGGRKLLEAFQGVKARARVLQVVRLMI